MAAMAGFRAALWARLGMLCLQAADYFENKRRQAIPLMHSAEQDQAETEASTARGRLNGAPPHWLAMVRDRAPGFLYRLETMSYANPPVTGANGGPAPDVAQSHHQPAAAALAYSTPEPDVRTEKRVESGVTGPLEKSGRIASSTGPERDDTKNRLRFKTPEIGQPSNRGQQARGIEPSVPATDNSRAVHRSRLNFKLEQFAAVLRPLPQAAASQVRKTGSIPNGPHVVAVEKKLGTGPILADEKPAEIRAQAQAIEQFNAKSGFKPSPSRHDRRPVFVRLSDADAGTDRVDRSNAGQTALIQNQAQMRNHTEQARHAATGNESISADSLWPALSGLEKTQVNRERWPELPEDVWNDFWRRQDAANTTPEQAEVNTTEALWNG